MEGEGKRERWRMKRDGDMHMRGGRIKERSRGTQQKKREEKNRKAEIEKE